MCHYFYRKNQNAIIEGKFDEDGRLSNYFVEVKDKPVVGRQDNLSTTVTLTDAQTTPPDVQEAITVPIKFQIVNYVADDKLKTDTRPATKTKGATDTKSDISKSGFFLRLIGLIDCVKEKP